MTKIVPAIIAKTPEDLREKLRISESFPTCKLVQIDVMDGRFVPQRSINFRALQNTQTKLDYELHLMVQRPERSISGFLQTKACRIIVHHEASMHIVELLLRMRESKIKTAVALNPNTPISVLRQYLGLMDMVVLLAVSPGSYGGEFQTKIYHRIRQVKKLYSALPVEVDGGVSRKNAKKLVASGADFLCVGSRIFQAENPKEAYKALRHLVL